MNQKDRKEFAALIVGTAEALGREVSAAAIEVMFMALADLSIEQVKRGVIAHLNDPQEGKYMLTPAHVRAHLHGTVSFRALNAWTKAVRAVERHGAWLSVVFDDPIIAQVIEDMGGWITFCVEMSDEPWQQKEFLQRYEGYAATGLPNHAPVKLFGPR